MRCFLCILDRNLPAIVSTVRFLPHVFIAKAPLDLLTLNVSAVFFGSRRNLDMSFQVLSTVSWLGERGKEGKPQLLQPRFLYKSSWHLTSASKSQPALWYLICFCFGFQCTACDGWGQSRDAALWTRTVLSDLWGIHWGDIIHWSFYVVGRDI